MFNKGTIITPNMLININGYHKFNVQETMSIIFSSGFVAMSWGINKILNIGNIAVRFKVNGNHHNGYVYILLNASDLYDVVLTTNSGEVVEFYNDIYCDQLTEIIDNRIEKIPDYDF